MPDSPTHVGADRSVELETKPECRATCAPYSVGENMAEGTLVAYAIERAANPSLPEEVRADVVVRCPGGKQGAFGAFKCAAQYSCTVTPVEIS